ncbi:ABC transporter ATP-binding protein [Schaalia suimastitidis]|uniref:ABC transporter ATP-binding protein n=1 Tax=Schaalia suimastitidis TaxID=121163 RepID=UPI00041A995C|nr:ABC transporter ATP-binding protein [Schaalia suimastitidis]
MTRIPHPALQSTQRRQGPSSPTAPPAADDHAIARKLSARHLSSGYGQRTVVNNVSVDIPTGKITVIIGANACGKSTLLKTLARVLPTRGGAVTLDDTPLERIPNRTLAKRLGLLPQQPIAPEGITVADLVSRGRHPHQGLFTSSRRMDAHLVDEALRVTHTSELAQRRVEELSGGQRQRVWIAMSLAQHTDILLLDEPTTFLDLAHQVEVLDLLTDLNRRRGTTIAMVLHDINLAARYGDHVIAMKQGSIVASGAPSDIIDEALIQEVYNLPSTVVRDPASDTPLVVPLGRHHVTKAEGPRKTEEVCA